MKSLGGALLVAIVLLAVTACGEVDDIESSHAGAEPTASPQSPLEASRIELSEGECVVTSASMAQVPDIFSLSWAAERIVIAEVAEVLPSVPDPKYPTVALHTDTVVRVEKTLRGESAIDLIIRRSGGEIPGGCVDWRGMHRFGVGERFLLFLGRIERAPAEGAYFIVGEAQGHWELDDANVVIGELPPHLAAYEGARIESIAQEIRMALDADAPTRDIAGVYRVVTLNDAPAGIDLPD